MLDISMMMSMGNPPSAPLRRITSRFEGDIGVFRVICRALVLSDQVEASRIHAERTEAEFLRELGERPSAALRSTARGKLADPPHGNSSQVVIRTILETLTAALKVGAVDAGLDSLRCASTIAEVIANREPQAEALAKLGTDPFRSGSR